MSKSWMGSIEGISLDWHEGLFVETEASPPAMHYTVHGPLRALDIPVAVYFDAKCCLCEWAYADAKDMPLLPSDDVDVCYGHKTPDIEEVLGWCREHRASPVHQKAVFAFKKKKGQ